MKELLEQLLPRVQKPARYIGNEWNSIHKDWDSTPLKMAFAFPDTYEVGMSHLGTRILYDIVNKRPDTLMERVFAPWVDMEKLMREQGLPLFGLESCRPLREYDIIGFTLQYEMSFTNILNMLDLAGIPLRAEERGDEYPLIIAGGPCAYNPEPLAPFVDLFVIGEGEEVIHELLDGFREWQEGRLSAVSYQLSAPGEALQAKKHSKQALLEELVKIPGIYVPGFYDVTYDESGRILGIKPNRPGVPGKVVKRVVKDFDGVDFPTKPIVPYTEIVHDRVMLEVLRGCTRGCRFCQAGVLYRPVREKKPETLLRQARELVGQTGYNEISLTSLSTSDYTCVGPVVESLLDEYQQQGIGISLPSLRIDSFSVDLAQQVQRVRKTGLTFAPEAGTQRLRDVINKGVTEENLVEAVTGVFKHGWTSIKLYFMIGLPTETNEDLDGIAHLANKVVAIANEMGVGRKGKGLKVTVSASSFVPKAHTPFQWEPQAALEELKAKQNYLKERIRNRKITFNWHDANLSYIEGVFARGDRRLAAALEKAWQLGCKFDGWTEHFKFETWLEAFRQVGIDPRSYANRAFVHEEILPWDHLSSGVSKEYLIREHRQALAEAGTGDCRFHGCQGCALCPDLDVEVHLQRGAGHDPY